MQALEQLVSEVKKEGRYKTIDIYTNGAIELYTGYAQGPPRITEFQTTLPQNGWGTNFGVGKDFYKDYDVVPIYTPKSYERQTKLTDYGIGSENKGLLSEKPFLYGYDLPETKTQIHFHGDGENNFSYGSIVDYDRNVLKKLNGYESSMTDYWAKSLDLKRVP